MKQNENVKINGEKAVLIPYEAHHVPKYHEWMKSEELQELTASEPLSLDQEYEMQKSWRDDENKCTYIVAEKKKYLHENSDSEIKAMVGDVNLFFNEQEDKSTAEIEIMIAEKDARGKGMGKEALLLMMRYGFEDLMVQRYTAKIGYSNHPSLAMFQKLGFVEVHDWLRDIQYCIPANKKNLVSLKCMKMACKINKKTKLSK
ncbi:hypothetical protein FSP39_018227 [Pinctada imbricata]|uniref:N-acetyltransferase 9-like protein n=1 Tax=Pinctada imbricata TaxID=66713 RepID=A0AA88XT48_PINIB|nr:hypothetical protein FSP39_018227 [Pinctada imbricata]